MVLGWSDPATLVCRATLVPSPLQWQLYNLKQYGDLLDIGISGLEVLRGFLERVKAHVSKRSNRAVPLPPKALAILAARRPRLVAGDALVFTTRVGSPFSRRNLLRRQLAPTAKRLNLQGINWHALRHANVTFLDSVGTPLGTMDAILGHVPGEVTRTHYIHNVPADARRALEKVEQLLIGPNRTQIVEIPKSVIQ